MLKGGEGGVLQGCVESAENQRKNVFFLIVRVCHACSCCWFNRLNMAVGRAQLKDYRDLVLKCILYT
jgi:hypothetical protein